MADAIFGVADDGAGTQIAVGANGLILKSVTGGASWTSRVSGTTNAIYSVVYGGTAAYGGSDGWVAVGQNGLILVSSTGDVWTTATTFTGESLYGVAVTGGIFLAVGAAGVFGLSADLGATWEAKSSGVVVDLFSISATPSLYTIVGDDDTVIIGSIASVQMESYIREDVAITPTEAETGTFQHVMTAAVEAADGYNWESAGVVGGELQYAYLADYFGAYDYSADPIGAFGHVLSESFDLLTTFVGNAGFRDTLAETLTITDTAARDAQILKIVLEAVQLSHTLTVAEIEIISELVSLSPSAVAGGTFNHYAEDTVSLRALYVVAWTKILSETVALTDTAARKFEAAVTITEDLLATGAASTLLMAAMSVAVSLEFSEALEAGKGAFTTETVTLTPTHVNNIITTAIELEQAVLSDAASQGLILSAPVSEDVALTATASISQIIQGLISDGVVFDLSFGLDGNTYTGWVMNADNFALSEYQNYPFNSFAKIGKQYYGANDNGIYLLEGSTDAGTDIAATFTTGAISFANSLSRVANAYLALRADGVILLKTLADDDTERWYELSDSDWTLRDKRVKMGRGVKSRYWQFTIANVDGANFEVDELVLLPIILKRR